jgi:hypothetical protein
LELIESKDVKLLFGKLLLSGDSLDSTSSSSSSYKAITSTMELLDSTTLTEGHIQPLVQ